MRNILYIMLMCFCHLLQAQLTQQNLDRYWDYKERLETKFMVTTQSFDIDKYYGTFIPANSRVLDFSADGSVENTGEIKFGDGTTSMGYYLAVLATQYRLLKDAGKPTLATWYKIAHVLWAIERLDIGADCYYGNDWCVLKGGHLDNNYNWVETYIDYPYSRANPCLNGFFIRDDVHYNFVDIWDDYVHPVTYEKPYEAMKATPNVESNYSLGITKNTKEKNEMSQDQMWNLMVGFSLVRELVDDTKKQLTGKGDWMTLKSWVQLLTYRMIERIQIHSNEWILGGLFRADNSYWWIYNPVTMQEVEIGGATGEILAKLFIAAGNEITDKIYGDLYHPNYGFNISSISPDVPVGLMDLNYENYNCHESRHGHFFSDYGRLALSTISQHTAYAGTFNQLMGNVIATANWYNGAMYGGDLSNFCFEHLPLMYLILHNPTTGVDINFVHYYLTYIKNQLDKAPSAEKGPNKRQYDYNLDGTINHDDYPCKEWCSVNRLGRPLGNMFCEVIGYGEFNGLDYMLMYNLYHLVYNKYCKNDINTSTTFPHVYVHSRGSFSVGAHSNENDFNICSDKEVNISSEIAGNVTVTSNTAILSPGFEVKLGGAFETQKNEHIGVTYGD